MFYIDQDQPSAGKTSSPCEASFVFNDNNFVITSNVQMAMFNTNSEYKITKMGFAWEDRFTINSIWGTTSDDFYVVGDRGNIAQYNGSSWTKIESGTEKRISDVCGIINTKTQKEEVYVTIAGSERIISRITSNNTLEDVNWPFTSGLEAIWSQNENLFYAVGEGIFRRKNSTWELEESMLAMDIDGENYNSVVVVGLGGKLNYFNGLTWYQYTPIGNSNLNSVSIRSNTIAITATYGNKIIIGRRN